MSEEICKWKETTLVAVGKGMGHNPQGTTALIKTLTIKQNYLWQNVPLVTSCHKILIKLPDTKSAYQAVYEVSCQMGESTLS